MSKVTLTNDQWVTEFRARVLLQDTQLVGETKAKLQRAVEMQKTEPGVYTWAADQHQKQLDKLNGWTLTK